MIDHALPAWDRFQGEPHSFSNLAGTVYFHFDMEAFDFHIDVAPDADPKDVCATVTQAEWWGLEVMDDDECEPELLANGRTRRYLTPIVPVEVTEAEAVAEVLAEAERLVTREAITEPIQLVAAEPGHAALPKAASELGFVHVTPPKGNRNIVRAMGLVALLPALPIFSVIVGVS